MNFVLFVLFIVLLFLVVFLYARLRDEIKNIKGRGIVEEVKKEIEGLIVEFNKVSNRKIIVMDEKIKELENLIKLADERILKLDTLTRNYAEMVKRYEIAKKEFQSVMLQSNNSKKIEQTKLVEEKKIEPSEAVAKKPDTPTKEIKPKTKDVLFEDTRVESSVNEIVVEERSELKKIVSKKELIEQELKNIRVEELDLEVRANLLHKLLNMNFDEDRLIEMGFSPSEIEIAKIVLKK